MKDKKGQEMTVSTLILLVLGAIILVLVILGFTMGWQNLWAKINIFNPSTDLDSVIAACKLSAASGATGSYCEFKSVTISGTKQYVNCEDNRVVGSLDKTLTCTTDAATFCKTLKLAKDATILVNGKVCTGALDVAGQQDNKLA